MTVKVKLRLFKDDLGTNPEHKSVWTDITEVLLLPKKKQFDFPSLSGYCGVFDLLELDPKVQ